MCFLKLIALRKRNKLNLIHRNLFMLQQEYMGLFVIKLLKRHKELQPDK